MPPPQENPPENDAAPEDASAAILRLRDALEAAREITGALNSAYWIVEEVTGYDRTGVMSHGQVVLPASQAEEIYELLHRLKEGEPLQHVLGRWNFRGVDLYCDRRALIPRPETEQVVHVALEELGRMSGRDLLVADLGTGSGAIALAMVLEGVPSLGGRELRVVATDISRDALQLAQENLEYVEAQRTGALGKRAVHPAEQDKAVKEGHAGLHGQRHQRRSATDGGRQARMPYPLGLLIRDRQEIGGKVVFKEGSWYEPLDQGDMGRFSMIVSNPPYLSRSQWVGLDALVSEYEPEIALVGGENGLECIRVLIAGAIQWLSQEGCVVLEIDPSQRDEAMGMAIAAGFSTVRTVDDLCNRPRVLVAGRR
ncbi:MAG: N5-glutamine methyltransferase family protein [Acidimicrobiales bacterium]